MKFFILLLCFSCQEQNNNILNDLNSNVSSSCQSLDLFFEKGLNQSDPDTAVILLKTNKALQISSITLALGEANFSKGALRTVLGGSFYLGSYHYTIKTKGPHANPSIEYYNIAIPQKPYFLEEYLPENSLKDPQGECYEHPDQRIKIGFLQEGWDIYFY